MATDVISVGGSQCASAADVFSRSGCCVGDRVCGFLFAAVCGFLGFPWLHFFLWFARGLLAVWVGCGGLRRGLGRVRFFLLVCFGGFRSGAVSLSAFDCVSVACVVGFSASVVRWAGLSSAFIRHRWSVVRFWVVLCV